MGELLAGFPFVVLGFHSDGGGEYINHDVAKLLEKLRVEFTRSRPRHTNDNALVENFHRPCYFATEEIDGKGNIRKRYPHQLIMTPFDKLQSLPPLTFNLRPGITLTSLEHQALPMTDNQAAKALADARSRLFPSIRRRSKAAA